MEPYFSHFSAAVEWDIPYKEAVFGYDISKAAVTHITVCNHDVRVSNNGTRAHTCVLPLPPVFVSETENRLLRRTNVWTAND
jgi:hypothetical protein